MSASSGTTRLIHGGGQVVKNVAGYDLMKVMTGSFGTLGTSTETTFKVRPIPERYTLAAASISGCGCRVHGRDPAA